MNHHLDALYFSPEASQNLNSSERIHHHLLVAFSVDDVALPILQVVNFEHAAFEVEDDRVGCSLRALLCGDVTYRHSLFDEEQLTVSRSPNGVNVYHDVFIVSLRAFLQARGYQLVRRRTFCGVLACDVR